MAIQSLNPFTNAVEKRFDAMSRDEILAAVEQAAESFKTWRDTSVADRSALMMNVVGELRDNPEPYAAADDHRDE